MVIYFNAFPRVLQIRDCMEHQASPIDGVTLTEALHQRYSTIFMLSYFIILGALGT